MSQNVIRQDVVQIGFEANLGELKKITKSVDDLKEKITGKKGEDMLDKVRKGAEKAKPSMDKLKKAADEVAGKVAEIGKKASVTAFNGLKKLAGISFKATIAGIGAVATALGTLVTKSVQAYADYEQLTGGVETLFKDSADIVMGYAKNAYKTAGVSANAYMETVTGFSASLLQSLGGDTKKAADLSQVALTDMSDNANKMGTDMEIISTTYGGFAKQNYSMLDNLKLGYGGTKEEMKRLVKDAAKIDKSVDANSMSFGNIVKAIHAVQDQMGITGTTAKEATETISGSLGSLKAIWEDTLTAFVNGGDELDDCLNNLIDSAKTFVKNVYKAADKALTNILDKLGPAGDSIQRVVDKVKALTKDTKKMKKIKDIFKGLKKAVEKVVDIVAQLVEKFIDFVTAEETLDAVKGAVDALNDALEWCTTHVEEVEDAIAVVIGVIGGLRLASFITDIITALGKIGLLKTELTGLQNLSLTAGVTLAVTGIVMEGKGIVDTITDELNLNNFGEIVGGGGALVGGAALIVNTFGVAALSAAGAAVVAGLGAFFAGVWDACKNGIDWLSTLLISGGAIAAGAGIGGLIAVIGGTVGGPVGAAIGAVIGLVVGLFTSFFIWLWQKWDDIKAWFSGLLGWFSKLQTWLKVLLGVIALVVAAIAIMCAPAILGIAAIGAAIIFLIKEWDAIKQFFVNLWAKIVEVCSTAVSWLNTNVVQPIVSFFTNAFYFLVGLCVVIWEAIVAIVTPIASWVYQNIISPVVGFFVFLWGKIVSVVKAVWSAICAVWGVISTWVNTYIISPVVTFFVGLWNKITAIVTAVWNSICAVWGVISGWVNENIISPVATFFSGLWDDITTAVEGVKDAITGAFQAAWDKVTEVWSGITGFFSGLWDGIKDTVNKLIGKGKEAMGVSDDVKGNDGAPKHAWGGLMTKPHFGWVAEDGPEMIIPLSNGKRNHALSLWTQAGKMLGVNAAAMTPNTGVSISYATQPTPESSSTSYSYPSSYEENVYSPIFNLTISGNPTDRELARKVKRYIAESMEDMFTGMANKNKAVREV